MIVSIFPSGSWQGNLKLPYPEGKYVTPLNPFICIVFGGYSVSVMNIDRWPEMRVIQPQLMNPSLDEAFDLATIQ
jgi:hypothetical protein